MRNLILVFLSHRRPIVIALHAILVTLAYGLAFLLRFEFALPGEVVSLFWRTLPLVLIVRLLGFWRFGLDRGLWRYVSVHDLLVIIQATTLTSLGFVALVLLLVGHGFPRSIYLLDWVLTAGLVAGSRLGIRAVREYHPRLRATPTKRAVVVGAGDSADHLLRELDMSLTSPYDVVALVDDNPTKRYQRIRGVEVAGSIANLPDVCVKYRAEEIIIAMPSATKEQLRLIVALCARTGLPSRRIPGLSDLLSGSLRIAQLQDIRPEELLDREIAQVDLGAVATQLSGKRVLITGAAGSIGSELARQVAALGLEQLVLLDRNETGLYFVYTALRQEFPGVEVIPAVGDILNAGRVQELLRHHRPHIVYHAAAFKHVPLMELNVLEAIANNVFGTELLVTEAHRHDVERFVLISTDKAVAPVSIMGMTKLVAERVIRTTGTGSCLALAVRFGNVLGSDGSVLPLFKWQASKWGHLAVTDPDATRYFMLPSEAVQLVLEAGRIGDNGDIFFLHMGEPVRMGDLVGRLLDKSGLEPGLDVQISVTGLRPGERLAESLVADREDLMHTSHHRIFRIRDDGVDMVRFATDLQELRQAVRIRDHVQAAETLKRMAGVN